MKILITGDKGFVGTETSKLIKAGRKATGTRDLGKLTTCLPCGSRYCHCTIYDHKVLGFDLMDGYDIRDRKQFEAYINIHKPDRVLHLAAIARFAEADDNLLRTNETNIKGTEIGKQITKLSS